MKATSKMLSILLLVMASLLNACEKDSIDYQKQFEKSYKNWKDFKSSSNNNYTYTVTSSSWVGFSTQTDIKVSGGVVVQRHFKYTSVSPDMNIPTEAREWTEAQNELNTHTSGAKPATLDEVYETARKEWLAKRKDARTYFETENSGLISLCGYVKEGCMDDCFIGIRISSIDK